VRDPPHVFLSLSPNEHGISDLHLDSTNNLVVARGAQAVAQHVRVRLMTYWGEWFLDADAGVTWLEDIMGKRFNPVLADALVKNSVLDTDGVTGINAFSSSYDRGRRDLMIRGMEVATEYDDQTVWISNLGIVGVRT